MGTHGVLPAGHANKDEITVKRKNEIVASALRREVSPAALCVFFLLLDYSL